VGFETVEAAHAASGFQDRTETDDLQGFCTQFASKFASDAQVNASRVYHREASGLQDERNGSSRRVPSHEETPAVPERLESEGVPGRPSVKCLLAAVVNGATPRAVAKQPEREVPEVRRSTSNARACPSSGAEEPFIVLGGLGG
jgi:hypothetical protein